MTENKLKILVAKFKKGECTEDDLKLLRAMSESDEKIKQLLMFGERISKHKNMMTEDEVIKRVKKLNARSRKSGKRKGMFGAE